MINHFLLTLTPDEEDRVLTTPMAGYRSMSEAGCLLDALAGTARHYLRVRQHRTVWFWPVGVRDPCSSVGERYDDLHRRYGARVNNAIRNRILANRARRNLLALRATALV
jgi:hypothetical protein